MRYPPATAVLLAAGRGQRLRPHTDSVPKPLLCVDGRPTLDYVLAAAKESGIQRVCLVTNYLEDQIRQHVGNGATWGIAVAYCHQTQLLGTANALQTAAQTYPNWFERERPFLLTATDYALPLAYLAELVAYHLDHAAHVTVGLKKLPAEEITRSSSVQFDQDGQVVRIIEKPLFSATTSLYAASLSYVLPHAILEFLPGPQPSVRGEFEIQSVINTMIAQGLSVRGLMLETPREWEPINSRIEYS